MCKEDLYTVALILISGGLYMNEDFCHGSSDTGSGKLVPIKVNRVFDSCSDKDCIRRIPVTLESELPCTVNLVKTRCVTVTDVCINVEQVPFNRGFYSIDITYTFNVELLAYERACDAPTLFIGTAFANKNCVLYGSESNTKTFFSDNTSIGETNGCCQTVNLPTASVSIVEPIALETKIECVLSNGQCCDINPPVTERRVLLTLGLFSVVELTRPLTIMVPTFDYTIPKKECCADDTPCEIFEKIKFPTEEFSPVTLDETENNYGCTHDCCHTDFIES